MFKKWKVKSDIILSCDWKIPEGSELTDSELENELALRTEVALNELGRITVEDDIKVHMRFHFTKIVDPSMS